jgi:GNAT superfamily N-acetyltransferase
MAASQQSLTLSPCTEEYWEFVRALRTDLRVLHGFIQQADITPEQQRKYMRAHWQEYFVALWNRRPAGFVGSVDGDIRVCTHPDYQGQGVGTFMVAELTRRFPHAFAKIKIDNKASKRLFAACGFAPPSPRLPSSEAAVSGRGFSTISPVAIGRGDVWTWTPTQTQN